MAVFALAVFLSLGLSRPLWAIIGLALTFGFYHLRRTFAERHAERMATLSVEKEQAKVNAIKDEHRRAVQEELPLTPSRRQRVPRRDQ